MLGRWITVLQLCQDARSQGNKFSTFSMCGMVNFFCYFFTWITYLLSVSYVVDLVFSITCM